MKKLLMEFRDKVVKTWNSKFGGLNSTKKPSLENSSSSISKFNRKRTILILAHLALLLMSIIYALNYSIAKIPFTSDKITPSIVVLFRVFIAGILYWIINLTIFERKNLVAFFKKQGPRGSFINEFRRNWVDFFLCGLYLVPLSQVLFFEGLKETNPVNASLMRQGTPFMALIFGFWANQERFTNSKVAGLIIAGIGATLVVLMGNSSNLTISWLGDIMILLSGAAFAAYTIHAKKLMQQGYTSLTVLKWSFLLGFLFFLVLEYIRSFDPRYINIVNQLEGLNWWALEPDVKNSLLFVFIAATFITYLLNISALDKVPPSIAGAYNYIQPFFAAVFAIFIFNIKINLLIYIPASILIFGGIYLLNNKEYKELFRSFVNFIFKRNQNRGYFSIKYYLEQFFIPESVDTRLKNLNKKRKIKVFVGDERDNQPNNKKRNPTLNGTSHDHQNQKEISTFTNHSEKLELKEISYNIANEKT